MAYRCKRGSHECDGCGYCQPERELEEEQEECCETCRWNEYNEYLEEWMCANEDSDCYAYSTKHIDECLDYEAREE